MMVQVSVVAIKNNHTNDIYDFNKAVLLNPRYVVAFKPSLTTDHVDIMMTDGMAYRVEENDPALNMLRSRVGS